MLRKGAEGIGIHLLRADILCLTFARFRVWGLGFRV